MFGTDWMFEEEFEQEPPWIELESEWFESIREAMRHVEAEKSKNPKTRKRSVLDETLLKIQK